MTQVKASLPVMPSSAHRPPMPGREVHEAMSDVRVSEALWSTGVLPEGVLERWLV